MGKHLHVPDVVQRIDRTKIEEGLQLVFLIEGPSCQAAHVDLIMEPIIEVPR